MRCLYSCGLWLCCLLSFPTWASSSFILNADSSGAALNGHIDIFEDVTGTHTIEQVSRPEFARRFKPAEGKASSGINPHPFWLRVRLEPSAGAPGQWWLEDGSINIRDLRLYFPTENGWHERQSGERVPYAEGRDYAMRSFVFKLPEMSETPLTFYVRSYNPAGNLFPLYIWQLEDLQKRAEKENLIFGAIYGAMLALLLYNICLLTILRDKSYFWYSLVTFTGLLLSLCISGHGFQYLWPNQPVSLWLDRTTLPSLWSMLLLQFTMVLLYTRDGLKWTHWLFWAISALYALTIVINGLGYSGLAATMMTFTPLISIPLAIFCAMYRSRTFLPARLYLVSYGLVFISGVSMILRSAGIIPPYSFVPYAFPFSLAIESLLFAFALAYRIQLLRSDKEYALKLASQEKSARISQFQNSALELQRLVNERTQDLAKANEQLRLREQELELAAHHDPLTGLPNRRYLLSHAQQSLSFAERHQAPAAFMVIDLDHFKPINDQFGHDAGDEVLKVMAKRLRDNLRGHDMVARLGGDEFAILISGPDAPKQASEVAERLLKSETQTVNYQGHDLDVGLSIGIAEFPVHGQDFGTLYLMADKALYQAKRSGRSCYRRYEPSDSALELVPSP